MPHRLASDFGKRLHGIESLWVGLQEAVLTLLEDLSVFRGDRLHEEVLHFDKGLSEMLKDLVIASCWVLIEVQDKTWHLTWLWRSLLTEGQARSEEDEVKG